MRRQPLITVSTTGKLQGDYTFLDNKINQKKIKARGNQIPFVFTVMETLLIKYHGLHDEKEFLQRSVVFQAKDIALVHFLTLM